MVPIRHHRRNPDQDLDRRERPRDTAFEHCTLREISISKVDRFLKSQAKVSYSRAKHAKVVLNLALGLALRYEAISRNPPNLGDLAIAQAAIEGNGTHDCPSRDHQARGHDLAAWWRTIRSKARWSTRGDHRGDARDVGPYR